MRGLTATSTVGAGARNPTDLAGTTTPRPRGRDGIFEQTSTSPTRSRTPTAELLALHGRSLAQERGLITPSLPKPFGHLTATLPLPPDLWRRRDVSSDRRDPAPRLPRPYYQSAVEGARQGVPALTAPTFVRTSARDRHAQRSSWAPVFERTGSNRTQMLSHPAAGRIETAGRRSATRTSPPRRACGRPRRSETPRPCDPTTELTPDCREPRKDLL